MKEIEKLRIGHRLPSSKKQLKEKGSAICTTFQEEVKGKSTRSILAQCWHRSERQLAKESYVIKAAENNPTQFGEIISQVDNEKKPVDSAYKEIKDELWRAQQLIDTEKLTNSFLAAPDKCQLVEGEFRKMSKSIASNSVLLIFTDPPYDEAHLWVYEPLGKIAARVPENWGFAYLLHQPTQAVRNR